MDSCELEIFAYALKWLEQGQQVTLVTVVETWGSAPRRPGALLAINEEGHRVGSVSGGCVEEDIIAKIKSQAWALPTSLTYGVTLEQSQRIGLSCGGTLKIVVEPAIRIEQIRPIVMALEQRQLISRCLDLERNHVTWNTVSQEEPLYFDGKQLKVSYGPAWQLLLIGAGQISRYLAEFGQSLNYHITVCDPRQEYLLPWQINGVELNQGMPDEVVKTQIRDTRSAVVTLTHDPRLDDLALLEALNSPAFYIGALGSQTTSEKRRLRLKKLGLPQSALARLHSPVGLPIGSHHPPEIAISILAEMTAVRYGSQNDTIYKIGSH